MAVAAHALPGQARYHGVPELKRTNQERSAGLAPGLPDHGAPAIWPQGGYLAPWRSLVAADRVGRFSTRTAPEHMCPVAALYAVETQRPYPLPRLDRGATQRAKANRLMITRGCGIHSSQIDGHRTALGTIYRSYE